MSIGYEYYYLFGLDIPLKKYNLGTIKQPKVIDYIKNDISMEDFYMPFLINDMIIGKSENNQTIIDLKNNIGSLTFLLVNCYQSENNNILESLKRTLCLLYDTDNFEIDKNLNLIVGEEVISNDNFDILSDVILEMIKIDKRKIDFSKKEDDLYAGLSKEMLEAKRKFLERNKKLKKKDDSFGIIDISNMIIHSGIFNYNDVMCMTLYQLKNSYEIISKKENSEISLLHRVSPKFEASDNYEHWTEKIKLEKSTLNQTD